MIGIIGAMEIEVTGLKNLMTNVKIQNKAKREFVSGKLHGKDVVIVRSGIGKVNAATCTQMLIDLYGVDFVINTGIAGALHKELDIGDMVISKDALYHDFDATGFGYELSVIPQMETSLFKADEKLVLMAKDICERVNKDIKTYVGRVVTGDQFVSRDENKKHILEIFDGYCTEMEGAAIAHTAYLNNIPFIIIRAISDKADSSANMDYSVFEAKAAEHSINFVSEFISNFK